MEKDRRHQEKSTRNYASKVEKWGKSEVKGTAHEGKRDAGEIPTGEKYEHEIVDARGTHVESWGNQLQKERKSRISKVWKIRG